MILLADESVDAPIVKRLRTAGHDVLAIAESNPGIPDDEVLERANEAKALLLTSDKDFGELVFRMKKVSEGVVLLRLHGLEATTKCDLVARTVDRHESELLHSFTVISPGMVRIRQAL